MFKISIFLVFISILTACDLFKDKEGNQFFLKKGTLFYQNHDMGNWQGGTLPFCTACSFNIDTKKMLPGAMLFKQINNERGDLVVLSATNIRYSFALQTGIQSFSFGIKIDNKTVKLSIEGQETLLLNVNNKQAIQLEGVNYYIMLQQIDNKKKAIDLLLWRVDKRDASK